VAHQLQTDEAVMIAGRLSIREEDTPKLLLDRIYPLRSAPAEEPGGAYAPPPEYAPRQQNLPRRLYLKMRADQRAAVLAILAETPGRIPVVLVEFAPDGSKKAVQAPESYWVDEGYDFGALANIIGADSIVLK